MKPNIELYNAIWSDWLNLRNFTPTAEQRASALAALDKLPKAFISTRVLPSGIRAFSSSIKGTGTTPHMGLDVARTEVRRAGGELEVAYDEDALQWVSVENFIEVHTL